MHASDAPPAKAYDVGPNITFRNLAITYEGGGAAEDVHITPRHNSTQYQPRMLGVRPAYALFLRRVTGTVLRALLDAWARDFAEGILSVGDVHCAMGAFSKSIFPLWMWVRNNSKAHSLSAFIDYAVCSL